MFDDHDRWYPFDYSMYSSTGYVHITSRRYEMWLVLNLFYFHSAMYYVYDNALISDAAFDRLARRARHLWQAHPGLRYGLQDPMDFVGSSLVHSYPPHLRRYFFRFTREYFQSMR